MEEYTEEIKEAFSQLEEGESLFLVEVEERHVSHCLIGAKTKEEAVLKVRNGEGEHMQPTEYVETLDSDTWDVSVIPPPQ